mgnify:CR=1 FL=1
MNQLAYSGVTPWPENRSAPAAIPTKRTVAYISGPVSTDTNGCPGKELAHVGAFIVAHRELMRRGYAVINPGLTWFADPACDLGWSNWIAADLAIIQRSVDIVVRLPGDSRGADEECNYANQLGIPVLSLEEACE